MSPQTATTPKVNDIAIMIATVNGSGSQTANQILMRAIFEMGIPVGAKNLFPSNIEGEPTWYSIRASGAGHTGFKREADLMVCANADSVLEDVKGLQPGAVCVYDAPLKVSAIREDLVCYEVPLTKLANLPDVEPRIRKLLANMVYVGALAELLQLDWAALEAAVQNQFSAKPKAVALNLKAALAGAAYVKKNFAPLAGHRLERLGSRGERMILDGNTAAAMGCVMAGCTVMGWYPITPASTICEEFIALAKKYRHDPQTGKATYATVQAEDELASLGIVLGAGWAGARAMTATSGPGLSLMAELVGLAYYAEIPAVIFDVQRAGPSTGLPTRTMQCDILSAAFLSHGDTKHILLLPGSVEECYEFALRAFDAAERFQTPVFVLSDLDLGMNNWVCNKPPYPRLGIDRGKVLSAQDLEALRAEGRSFERYRDFDYDGIPYRTLPGTNHPMASYFTRGTGHNKQAQYSEDAEDFTRNLNRVARKIERAAYLLPAPLQSGNPAAEIGLIAYGSTHAIMPDLLEQLERCGIPAEYLRLRSFPLHPKARAFIERKKRVYVIDQNRDGQMHQLLTVEAGGALSGKLVSVRHFDGWPVDARSICQEIALQETAVKTF